MQLKPDAQHNTLFHYSYMCKIYIGQINAFICKSVRVQWKTSWCNTVHCNTATWVISHSLAQRIKAKTTLSAKQHILTKLNITQHNVIQHDLLQHNDTQRNTSQHKVTQRNFTRCYTQKAVMTNSNKTNCVMNNVYKFNKVNDLLGISRYNITQCIGRSKVQPGF